MKKVIVLAIILASTLVLAFDMTVADIESVLKMYTNPSRAHELAEAIFEECNKFSVPASWVVVLIVAESNVKNVLGDGGEAVGYFQLHKEAVWYVSYYFKEFRKYNKDHTLLIYNPIDQVKIAVRYIYLMDVTSFDELVRRWNPGRPTYYLDVVRSLLPYLNLNL